MQRVLVAGISGAGKTTLAMKIEAELGVPHTELDALHHGPGWQRREAFEADAARLADSPRWVTEDQYHDILGDVLWQRADTVVWLDLPRSVVMRRVIWRTVTRVMLRRRLFNGNREDLRALLDPGHPARWAWTQHARRRAAVASLCKQHVHVDAVRLRTTREVRAFERRLTRLATQWR